MPEPVNANAGFKVIVNAAHRNGICIDCNIQMEVKHVDIGGGKIAKRPVCPECGGMTGQLIVRPTSIQAPNPPSGISPKCLWKFVLDSVFLEYLSSYHRQRVAYAEKNRPEKGKKILEKYRTGEPSPKTSWGAIKEIIRLKLRR